MIVFIISIHAPANGATSTSYGDLDSLMISIHAPANGATSDNFVRITSTSSFQSTLRRTERLREHRVYLVIDEHFNPRSGERSDKTKEQFSLDYDISIHAPANGATL